MNPTEATVLLTYIARVDHRTFSQDDADTYADLLDDVSLPEAMHAARAHLRDESTWLSPALIRRRALALRRQLVGREWCGKCEQRTHQVLDPETLKPTGRCPICHPLGKNASTS